MILLKDFAANITYDLLNLAKDSLVANALNFSIYDTIKIFMLLTAGVFIISVSMGYFDPEKTKQILSHKIKLIPDICASLSGIFTPFCWPSTVPLPAAREETG